MDAIRPARIAIRYACYLFHSAVRRAIELSTCHASPNTDRIGALSYTNRPHLRSFRPRENFTASKYFVGDA